MRDQRSRLGLDDAHSFFEKLGLFLSALFLGPLLGLLLFAGVHPLEQPLRSLAEHCCEALAVFWAGLLLFIWWRPPWFRRLYLLAEQKALVIVRIVGVACLLVVGAAVLVAWLREMHLI